MKFKNFIKTKMGWLSFDLSSLQENNKLTAVRQNISQQAFSHTYDLLQSFVKKNEIFEEIN